ncbi:MAG: hypothetical protein EPN23_10510, partial [Verrucomicrobia bacterium]
MQSGKIIGWLRKVSGLLCTALAAVCLWPQGAGAGNVTLMTNVADNSLWSGGANWQGGVAPVAGDALFFATNVNSLFRTVTNDLAAGTTFNGITFSNNAIAYTLAGNGITLGGDIANNSTSTQTINLALSSTATRTINGGVIRLNGDVTITNASTQAYLNHSSGKLILGGNLLLGAASGSTGGAALGPSGGETILASGSSLTMLAPSFDYVTLSGAAVNNPILTIQQGATVGPMSVMFIGANGTTGTLNIDTNATVRISGGNLYVGGSGSTPSGGTGTLNIRSGASLFTDSNKLFNVGYETNAVGTVNMESGATLTASNTLTLAAFGRSSTGIINMAGATLNVVTTNGGTAITTGTGSNSLATINILANTTNTITGGGAILLGSAANVSGALNLQSGSMLNVSNSTVYVGTVGTGALNMTNASLVITGGLYVGRAAGVGTANMTNSTLTVGGDINVGFNSTSTGSMNIQAGSATVTGNLYLGRVGGVGTVTMTNSTLTVGGGTMAVGFGGTGTMNIQAGSTLNRSVLYVARLVNTTGTVNQSGGTVTATSALEMGQDDVMSLNSGIYARYNLSGGTLSAGTINSVSLKNSTAEFVMSGGQMNAANGLYLGESGPVAAATNSTFRFVQSGGTATVNSLYIAGQSSASYGNTAYLTISNGVFSSTNFSGLALGNSSTGLVYFGQGSVVTLPAFPTTKGAGSYTELTFDGGTLSNRAASTSYLQGLDHAYLTTNGAIFNVGANIT